MLPVLIQSLILAASGLLSIGSITLVILLLISDRGWKNGLGYALGYTTAYTVIGMGTVLAGYRATGGGPAKPSLVFPVVMVALGGLLLWLAIRNWRKPPSDEKKPNRFFAIVDTITPLKAFGFGALVTVINFKNLALYLSAVSVIILSSLPLPQKLTIAALVALVFCLSVIIPVLVYLSAPRRAAETLGAFKFFLERHSRAIGIWLPLIFGIILIMKGLSEIV